MSNPLLCDTTFYDKHVPFESRKIIHDFRELLDTIDEVSKRLLLTQKLDEIPLCMFAIQEAIDRLSDHYGMFKKSFSSKFFEFFPFTKSVFTPETEQSRQIIFQVENNFK